MDANELRALADALPEGVHWSDPITPDMLAEAIRRFCADAQPVAVPAGWKLVPVEPTPEMLVAARDWSIQKNGIGVGNDQATGCFQAMLAAAPAVPQAEPKRDQSMLDLLAVIHCDGGHHTEAVGIEQSIKDALTTVCVLKGKLAEAEPKREPLMALLELAEQSDDCQRGILTTSIVRELVNEALGIGGSDER